MSKKILKLFSLFSILFVGLILNPLSVFAETGPAIIMNAPEVTKTAIDSWHCVWTYDSGGKDYQLNYRYTAVTEDFDITNVKSIYAPVSASGLSLRKKVYLVYSNGVKSLFDTNNTIEVPTQATGLAHIEYSIEAGDGYYLSTSGVKSNFTYASCSLGQITLYMTSDPCFQSNLTSELTYSCNDTVTLVVSTLNVKTAGGYKWYKDRELYQTTDTGTLTLGIQDDLSLDGSTFYVLIDSDEGLTTQSTSCILKANIKTFTPKCSGNLTYILP